MTTYIFRRILFMIPTLIGITFLVFMLIAASPGGIGAGLLVSGGAMQSQNAIAIQRAKLEDRYGLNEPVLVQYVRWFRRICPVKFGPRDLVNPTGELVSRPRPMPEPDAWRWLTAELPDASGTLQASVRAELDAMAPEERAQRFRRIEADYIASRAEYIAAGALMKDAIKRYAEAAGRSDWVTRGGEPRVDRIVASEPDRGLAAFAEVEEFGRRSIAAYAAATAERERYLGAIAAAPYPAVGVPIIPGMLSLAKPDLGVAFSRQLPVSDLIVEALPVTMLLNLIAIPIIYVVAISSGMLAAVRRGTFADIGLGMTYIALFSIPTVLAGVLLQGYMANPDFVNMFPTAGLTGKGAEAMPFLPSYDASGGWVRGWLLDRMWHIVLPVTCLVYTGFAVLSKQTRAAMLENLNADYVRTAKAKGVAPRDVIFRHVFRNSLLPLITMFVTIFPAMLAGSVVVERIFSIPGMGSLLIEAINLRDRELILANTTMVAVVNLLALLLADILYAFADPRISYK